MDGTSANEVTEFPRKHADQAENNESLKQEYEAIHQHLFRNMARSAIDELREKGKKK